MSWAKYIQPLTFTLWKGALEKGMRERFLSEIRARQQRTIKGLTYDLLFKRTSAGWSLILAVAWVLLYAFDLEYHRYSMIIDILTDA